MGKEPVLIEGILKKKSPKTFLGRPIWQDRYFVLTYSQLCYYKRKEDVDVEDKCLGYLLIENISGAVDLEGVSGGLRFNVLLEGADRLFELEAPSRPLVLSWVQAIKTSLQKYGKKPVSLAPLQQAALATSKAGAGGGGKFWKPQEHKKIIQQRRAAISAEYLTDGDNDEQMKNRNFHKTGHERATILGSLRECQAFNIMDDIALQEVCNIMWEVPLEKGQKVCQEGQSSSLFYILVSGKLSASTSNPAFVSSPSVGGHPSSQSGQFQSVTFPSSSDLRSSNSNGDAPSTPRVKATGSLSIDVGGGGLANSVSFTSESPMAGSGLRSTFNVKGNTNSSLAYVFPGNFFGEVALLYEQQITHTILAVEDSKCFALDRTRYKKLVASASQRIYTQRTNFLRSIPLFTNANNDLITQVAEALEVRYIKCGETIISEGQAGDEFYVLEAGRCSATCKNQPVCIYQRSGDFFGELALLKNQPRACTISADTDCKVLYLSKVDFELFRTHLEPHLKSRHGLYRALPGVDGVEEASDDEDIPPPPPPPLDDVDGPLGYIPEDSDDDIPPPPPPMDDQPAHFFGDDEDTDSDNENTNIVIRGDESDDDQDDNEFAIMTGGAIHAAQQSSGPGRASQAMMAFPQGDSLPRSDDIGDLPTLGVLSYEQRAAAPSHPLPPEPPQSPSSTYNPDSVDARLDLQKQLFGENAALPKHMQRISVLPTDPLAQANKKKLYEFGNGPNHVCTIQSLSDLQILGTLGRGTFGHVQLVKDKHEHIYALKAVNKSHVVRHNQIPHILHERETMLELDHPFIVKLYRTLRDNDYLYFLLEPSLGGELFTVLRNYDHFDNDTARFYAAIVVSVFQYIHQKDILYRDLKPENLLMDADGYIRVTDFGFAKKTRERTYTFCGTPDYLAPEIVASAGHHVGADWWCLGVLIYEMLAGYTPFYDDAGPSQMYTKILAGKVYYPPHFTAEAKDIVQSFLQIKPTRRLGVILGGAEVIRNHAWFHGLDWEKLLARELPSPIPVQIKNKFDLTNFDAYPDDDACTDPFTPDPDNPWDEIF